jgi:hypothetical protein
MHNLRHAIAPLRLQDGVASAVLDMWLCVGAEFFVATRGSMYSDFIERFRVASGAAPSLMMR